MLLPPKRPQPYTAESYVDDLVGGRIGFGSYSRSGNTYNFKIEFERMSPEDQELALIFIREDETARKRFDDLDEAASHLPDSYDSLGLKDFLDEFIPALTHPSDARERKTVLPVVSPRQRWQQGLMRAHEACFSSVVQEDAVLAEACLDAEEDYLSLPLIERVNARGDDVELSPQTAGECGKRAFQALVQTHATGLTPDLNAAAKTYLSCEVQSSELTMRAMDVEDIRFAIFDALPNGFAAKKGLVITDIPLSPVRAISNQGFYAEDVENVAWRSSAQPGQAYLIVNLRQAQTGESAQVMMTVTPSQSPDVSPDWFYQPMTVTDSLPRLSPDEIEKDRCEKAEALGLPCR